MIYEQETSNGKRWFVPSNTHKGYYVVVEAKWGGSLVGGGSLTCSGEHCQNRPNACRHMKAVGELELVFRPIAESVSEW